MSLNYEFNHILGIYQKSLNKNNLRFLNEIWNDYVKERKVAKIKDKVDFYIYMQMHSKWSSIV